MRRLEGEIVRIAVTLCAVLLGATAVRAQTAATANHSQSSVREASDPPAPPADASDDQLRSWISHYVDKGSYVEAALDAHRLILLDPSSLKRLPDGHVVGWVRSELFQPVVVDGHPLRSVRKQLEINCSEWRYKELVFEGYAGANLQRRVSGLPTSDAWTKPLAGNSSAGKPLRMACTTADRN
jgi:hypothetical protein